ncbi:MAG: cytochrome C [Rubrivivax sp.]|jgi:hypothetical protein|nr:cytochrome C [Rubrivivax sp.]
MTAGNQDLRRGGPLLRAVWRFGAVVLGVTAIVLSATVPAAAAAEAAAASAPAPTHRPLRSHVPAEPPPPTDPQVFAGYPGAPAFTVVPRKGELVFYPCSNCHKVLPLNPTPRKLVGAPHPAALDHGAGRMWCLDCHTGTDRDVLHSIGGERIDFDQSDRLCGQCHGTRHRDWFFGGHGKRVAQWQGERRIYSCTHCHDPHSPTLKPRQASKPPPVRAGLEPMPRHERHADPLQRLVGPAAGGTR